MSEKPYIKYYNKNLKEKARSLRNNSTKSEIVLWKNVLKSSQLEGYKFNRQKSLLNYIVDFFCKELNLIIEIDGSTHDNVEAKISDNCRQNELENAGFNFIRYSGYEILNNIEGIRQDLILKIKEIEKLGPPPNPLREGK